MKFNKKTIYITLFAILYICVAVVSTLHAISFFGLANNPVLAVILAITFEIGQAAVLFSILTSNKDRSKKMPWVLMFVLTFVQILGNVFSSYKYLITNSVDQLRYFKEPIFVWTELPDAQCNVILTYIIGAILPVVALCMTSMVTGYLEDENEPEVHKDDIQGENESELKDDIPLASPIKTEPASEPKESKKSHFVNLTD